MVKTIFSVILIVISTFVFYNVKSQTVSGATISDGSTLNLVQTAVPFLLITPDSRSAGMGDAAIATSPDANAFSSNPSKIAFIKSDLGFSISYAPWLRSIVSDINLFYLSSYCRLSEKSVLGASVRYFSLGNIPLTTSSGNHIGTYSPNEFAFDLSLSRKFGEYFSLGLTGRYIRSDLSNNQFSIGQTRHPANGYSIDVSSFYNKPISLFDKESEISFGLNIANIGPGISYAENAPKYSLPTSVKLGSAATMHLDNQNKLTLAFDINKIMVPPIRQYNPDDSFLVSMFRSFSNFYDVTYSIGTEYWAKEQFAGRLGYFYEPKSAGGRQYLTVGGGFHYQEFGVDVAYIIANPSVNPLANTVRFSILYNIGPNH